MGADFLEYDGHIPGRLEAGSGRGRGLRLGVCRKGTEKDSQPHYFNLSCKINRRRPEEEAGEEREARRWVRRFPCLFRYSCPYRPARRRWRQPVRW